MYHFVELIEGGEYLTTESFSAFEIFEGKVTPKKSLPCVELVCDGRKKTDFYYFSPGVIGLNGRAKEFIESFFIGFCEVVPVVESFGNDIYILNVTKVADILDKEKSEVTYFKSTGDVKRIEKYSFINVDEQLSLFKLPETRKTEIFCDDLFISLFNQSGLVGLRFVSCD